MKENKIQICFLNYPNQKIWQTLARDIRKYWTAVSTLLGLISSVYRDLHHWRSMIITHVPISNPLGKT